MHIVIEITKDYDRGCIGGNRTKPNTKIFRELQIIAARKIGI